MKETIINKRLLADEATRYLIEHPFESLNEEQAVALNTHYIEHDVQQFVFSAEFCANELTKESYFTRDSLFVANIDFLWDCFNNLPDDLRGAFRQFGAAIERMTIHVMFFVATAHFIDDVICHYVETHDAECPFIQETLELFDMIDTCYHPKNGGSLSEEEREFILERTSEAFRPLHRTKMTSLRDRIAVEVFEMVREWGDDELYIDKYENYPVGPDIEAEDIMQNISRIVSYGRLNREELNAYKHLKIREIAELIKVHRDFEQVNAARALLDYLGTLVNELGDDIRPSYLLMYQDAQKRLATK